MKRFGIMLFWLLGILFPMAWLGNFSGNYRQVFNFLFAPEWVHWLMHATLYAGLAILLMIVFSLPTNRHSALLVFRIIVLVGVIQEILQLLSAVQIVSWNSLFDLGVDLIGAALGLGVVWGIKKNLRDEKTPGGLKQPEISN